MPGSISWRKFVQKFRRLGFDGPYGGGRHLFLKKRGLKVIIPNPHHGDISKRLIAEILRHAGISKTIGKKFKSERKRSPVLNRRF